jgi:L-2-hydroxyglutarate oxidase LhgO
MTDRFPIAIIGGGALGLAVAHTLLDSGKQNIVLLEKIEGFGLEQSGVFDASFFVSTLYRKAADLHVTPDLFMKGCSVVAAEPRKDCFRLHVEQLRGDTPKWQLDCEILVNAAGLYSWDIAKTISPCLLYEKQYLRGRIKLIL